MFQMGQLYTTCGVANRIAEDNAFKQFVYASLWRYLSQDWGEMVEEDKALSDRAILEEEGRIFGAYQNAEHPDWHIWIITEAERTITTILFPDEY